MTLTQLQQEALDSFREEYVITDHGPDADDHDCAPDAWNDRFPSTPEEQIAMMERHLLVATTRVYAAALDSVESWIPEEKTVELARDCPTCSALPQVFCRHAQGSNDMRDELLSHLRTLREGITGNEHAK